MQEGFLAQELFKEVLYNFSSGERILETFDNNSWITYAFQGWDYLSQLYNVKVFNILKVT